MSALRWSLVILGVVLLLAGIVFALQGATGIGGGSSMDNNPFWIYAGAAIAVVGAALVAGGYWVGRPKATAAASPGQ